ncbi:MAG: EamA family transporter [Armatimonadota bacterium]
MDKLALGYLLVFAAIVGFAVYGVSFKYCSFKGLNLSVANTTMYLATTITIAVSAYKLGVIPWGWPLAIGGIALGCSSYAFVLCFRKASALGSTAVAWTILQMSIVLPFLASALFYHEIPKWNHWLGLLFTGIGVALLGRDVQKQAK